MPKKFIIPIRNTAIFVLITLALLEALVRLVPSPEPKELFQMKIVSSVLGLPWMNQWYAEHDQLRRDFRAYEIYGLDRFRGSLINIDAEGFRQGHVSHAPGSKDVTRIGVFGGSTAWGSYSRDEYTIPSYLGSSLESEPQSSYEVRNYAQVGFVFSQEVHEALRLLYSSNSERGFARRVIFFDGVNDVLAAIHNYTQGLEHPASLPWEYQKYRYLFQLGKTGEVSAFDIFKKLKFVRMTTKLMENRGWIKGEPKGIWRQPSEGDMQRLSAETARQYVNLLKVTHHTFAANGVRPTFVLQPILLEKKFPTPEEVEVLNLNQEWQPYLRNTYAQIRTLAHELPAEVSFIDMSDFFRDEKKGVFSDVIHYTEGGNQRIATHLASVIKHADAGRAMTAVAR